MGARKKNLCCNLFRIVFTLSHGPNPTIHKIGKGKGLIVYTQRDVGTAAGGDRPRRFHTVNYIYIIYRICYILQLVVILYSPNSENPTVSIFWILTS